MGQQTSNLNNCIIISNDEIVFRMKQQSIINKIIDILLSIENGNVIDISKPELYLVDINYILSDLMAGKPSNITLKIFQPYKKIFTISNDIYLTEDYTIIHSFNDFILRELPLLSEDQLKQRAQLLRLDVSNILNNLNKFLSQICENKVI